MNKLGKDRKAYARDYYAKNRERLKTNSREYYQSIKEKKGDGPVQSFKVEVKKVIVRFD
tara:strand:- start:24 stop:200 length:177 start_codon:yes stop_codon:yes gene_type:complete